MTSIAHRFRFSTRSPHHLWQCLLFIIIHIFSTHFVIKIFFFAQLENVNKLWNSKRTVHVNERTKSKQKQNQVMSHSNWPSVVLFDLAHKPCNGIIKGWLHCLTSDSKGRFLANNILMFGSSWFLVMAQIQFSLIKIIKIRRPEHSANSPPPYVR